MINEFPQHFLSPGVPAAQYVVYFGEPNQDPISFPKAPFSDDGLTTPISPEQTLNDNGAYSADIFLDGNYSVRIETPLGSLWRETSSITGVFSEGQLFASQIIYDTKGNTVNEELDEINDEIASIESQLGQSQSTGDKRFWPTVSNGADTDHDIDFSAGEIADSDGDLVIDVAAITKRIEVIFLAGNNEGGMFDDGVSTPVAPNTTYHLFVIYDVINDIVDAGFDILLNAGNRPAAYTKYRRIGSIYTDGSSDIVQFTQHNDTFLLDDVVRHYSDTTPGTGAQTLTADIPTGLSLQVIAGHGIVRNGDSYVLLTALTQTNSTPAANFATLQTSGSSTRSSVVLNIQTDSSGNYRFRSSTGTTYGDNFALTYGWIDDRTQ
jgi:hypothetical protein